MELFVIVCNVLLKTTLLFRALAIAKQADNKCPLFDSFITRPPPVLTIIKILMRILIQTLLYMKNKFRHSCGDNKQINNNKEYGIL